MCSHMLSIVCPRKQDISWSQENKTKDSGNKYTFIPVFIINKNPRHGACDRIVIITRLLVLLEFSV